MSDTRKSPSGAFVKTGVATLVAGTVTVTQTIPPGAMVLLTRTTVDPAVATNWGHLGVFIAANRLSFKITSSNNADVSTIGWAVI
jgi:hypothetical protein